MHDIVLLSAVLFATHLSKRMRLLLSGVQLALHLNLWIVSKQAGIISEETDFNVQKNVVGQCSRLLYR
jgi:hypothetical protein